MENLSYTIKDIPESERPRERLLKYGPEALSNAELLAIIIRTGFKSMNSINIANQLISSDEGLSFLATSSVEELSNIKGIGSAKAAQIKAALELGNRLRSFRSSNKEKISNPSDAAMLVMDEMRYLKKEYLKVMFLNTKNVVIAIKDISIGSLNSSIVHPREIYCEAIKRSSSSIILFHNHPSGDCTESKEDINITKRIFDAGKIIGIDLLDHIIIGDGIYNSLKEKGFF